jgi:hypothetical protein
MRGAPAAVSQAAVLLPATVWHWVLLLTTQIGTPVETRAPPEFFTYAYFCTYVYNLSGRAAPLVGAGDISDATPPKAAYV